MQSRWQILPYHGFASFSRPISRVQGRLGRWGETMTSKSSTVMLKIAQAETAEDLAIVREFMLEYAAWLKFELCFQGFDEELRTLPGKYAPPGGRLFLARWTRQPAGIGALRPLDESGVCEMKRLYIRPEFRGHSLGEAIAKKLIEDARAIGYKAMRLDTVPGKMDSAIALYRRLGFKEIKPYYSTPVQHTLFMELALPHSSAAGSDRKTANG